MSEEAESLAEGTLISHLLELRNRVMRVFLAVIVVFIPCAIYATEIFGWLAEPLKAKLPADSSLIVTNVTAAFTTPFKLAFVTALVIAMPYVIHQVWAFVAPGLYRKEKSFARPLLYSSIALFYCGIAFSYFVLLPVVLEFFINYGSGVFKVTPDITAYMDFVITVSFAFGVAFETPVAVVLLVLTGMIETAKLASIRGYVLIGIFVIAAFLTPPDAISQSMMALPMYALYEIGLLCARVVERKKAAAQQSEGNTV